jgi:DNA-binding PucR family transcriptional regulator
MSWRPVSFEEAEDLLLLGEIAELPITKEFVERTLGALMKEKRHEELLKTLETYLACDKKKVKTAETLTIHLNTLKYRIKKIEALLGKPLDSPDTSFKLQLALKLYRII